MGSSENTRKTRPASDRKLRAALVCGMLGCIFMGSGDWLMMYGDTTYHGTVYWLTEGVAQIPPWRNALAMFLAFPGILFYGIALFAIAAFLKGEKQKAVYRGLTAFGMTPWLCIHLYVVMILYAFAWMNANGYETAALPVAEALYSQYLWALMLGEGIMVLPFLYWAWLLARGSSVFPRWMGLSNPLVYYVVLKAAASFLPDSGFRLAFSNGLMSESMLIWFASLLAGKKAPKQGAF